MTQDPPTQRLRSAVYARESVDYEMAVAHQIRLCCKQASEDGMPVPDDPSYRFADNDATGANADRNDFQRMLRLVESGQAGFQRLYVKDRSRFGRFDDVRQQFSLEYMLETRGIQVRYLDEDPIDWTDSSGKALGSQLFAFIRTGQTAAERRNLRRRTRGGKRDAVIDGSYPHPMAPWGLERWHWNRSENRWIERVETGNGSRRPPLVIGLRWKPVESALIREIFEMAESGTSQAEIARKLSDRGIQSPGGNPRWNRTAVAKILRNPIYVGDLIWGRGKSQEMPVHFSEANSSESHPILYPDFAPGAPVPRNLRDRVHRILEGQRVLWERRRATSERFLLGGLLTCAGCGAGFHGHARPPRKDGSRLRYYRHDTPHRAPSDRSDGKRCPLEGRNLRAVPIENAVVEACRTILGSPHYRQLVEAAIADRLGQSERLSSREGLEDLENGARKLREEVARAARRAAEESDPDVADAHDNVAKAKAKEARGLEARVARLRHEGEVLERIRADLPEPEPTIVGAVFDDLEEEKLKTVIGSLVHHAELDAEKGDLRLVCRTNPGAVAAVEHDNPEPQGGLVPGGEWTS